MLTRLMEDARNVPEKLQERSRELTHKARERIHHTRTESQERLWELQTRVLERADDLLERGTEVKGVGRMAQAAHGLVERALQDALALPEGYEEMNAKDAMSLVRNLDLVPLLRVRKWELNHKDRKTVKAAIDKRLEQLDAFPAPPPRE